LGAENVTPRDLLSRIDQEKNAGRLPDQMKVGPGPKSQLLQRGYCTAVEIESSDSFTRLMHHGTRE
jgi:hypothetical protein